jgi:glycosyltransferase involved in cell wall biosynthesis
VTRPRLLFVVNVDWFFLSHRLPVALAARDAGFEVHVATGLSGPAETIESHGFVLHPLHIDRRDTGLRNAWVLWLDLVRIFRRVQPDVVHLVTIKPVLLGGLAARVTRVPRVIAAISGLGFIFTARGPLAKIRSALVSRLYRLALARPGVRVIFQNGDDQALLQRHAGIRDEQVVRIRGSGVDVAAWPVQALPAGAPVVLMAARLLVDKGVHEFVEAARLLRGHRGARFVLAGDLDPGNPTSLARQDLTQWVDNGLIEWWGHREDMPDVLASAHVVVLPSYREGLPKVLIEAAASGRAVVTTDVPGCRDAIDAGTTGLLVPARDGPALAQAIRSLLDDPARCASMGQAGRRLAEAAFDVSRVVDSHLALYREAVGST